MSLLRARRAVLLVVLSLSCSLAIAQSPVTNAPEICADAGEKLRISVAFNVDDERGITITEAVTQREMMSFNNRHGRGADARWRTGADMWTTPAHARRTCYRIAGLDRLGAAGPGAWRSSHATALEAEHWGFDDDPAGDHLDVLVSAHVLRQLSAALPTPMPDTATAVAADPALPQFSPWPPPDASSRHFIERKLVTGRKQSPSWGSVSDRFTQALGRAGYQSLSFYAVPEGFAIATRIERIDNRGNPAEGGARWVGWGEPTKWTLQDTLRRLVGQPLGRFRAIVFVFSPIAMPVGGPAITETQAEHWRRGGLDRLPRNLRRRQYDDDFRCDVLVYEFEHRDKTQPAVPVAGGLPIAVHLSSSRILLALEQTP